MLAAVGLLYVMAESAIFHLVQLFLGYSQSEIIEIGANFQRLAV